MRNGWLAAGALAGATAVVLGAFGAHALRERLDARQLEWWQTAVLYHALHALAWVAWALWREARTRAGARPGAWVGACFAIGLALFSGTLYAMALGAPHWLGAITPFGGTALIVAWLGLAAQAWRSR